MVYDIYSNNEQNTNRYTLGKSGTKKLYVIGLNPSIATSEKSDTTISKVKKVAELNGYDGFVMLNLYPVRSTDYRALADKVDKTAFDDNLAVIESLVNADRKVNIWAAWGEGITSRAYFAEACKALIECLENYDVRWQQFGKLTMTGHPRHPSRLHYDWMFEPFNVIEYKKHLMSISNAK